MKNRTRSKDLVNRIVKQPSRSGWIAGFFRCAPSAKTITNEVDGGANQETSNNSVDLLVRKFLAATQRKHHLVWQVIHEPEHRYDEEVKENAPESSVIFNIHCGADHDEKESQ